MIAWSDEAVQAAVDVFIAGEGTAQDDMRAALDAASAAQGLETIGYRASEKSFERGRLIGRAEALEEAAAYMETTLPHLSLQEYAAAIRALKEKQG